MLTLLGSPTSPFVRKVRVSAAILGLEQQIEVKDADTSSLTSELVAQNPLAKIPTLILQDQTTLYDSRVIVEYLDFRAGGNIIFPEGQARFIALRQQALADGLMDAALLQVYEKRMRASENYDEGWIERQKVKVANALNYAEAHLAIPTEKVHIGHIAQACALGYLDLRFNGDWRKSCPRLESWLNSFSERVPAFSKTAASLKI
ncbi:glutathione S-transferase N-terminal domain-containing protein [Microvirga sp. W0021]|uniref:Glutathione S-transferase N-terminal domain-containing protein n=1 Tax=Hohaiivirga grylli TaxID=3133970 RepID=A0ABV0BJY1_9HYPH